MGQASLNSVAAGGFPEAGLHFTAELGCERASRGVSGESTKGRAQQESWGCDKKTRVLPFRML